MFSFEYVGSVLHMVTFFIADHLFCNSIQHVYIIPIFIIILGTIYSQCANMHTMSKTYVMTVGLLEYTCKSYKTSKIVCG